MIIAYNEAITKVGQRIGTPDKEARIRVQTANNQTASFASKTDEETVALAQEGDIGATEYLLDKYKSLVKARARAYFLIGADREDIIQEGMIGLYKAIRDFRPDKQSNFSAFADLCATRQIVTAIKTATRLKHTPLNNYISLNKPMYENESEKSLIDLVAETIVSDPEQIVINAESFEQISSEIFKYLSKFEKDVLRLYLDGKSYQEISEELNRTSKSIDNALQRIKKKLETQLTTSGEA